MIFVGGAMIRKWNAGATAMAESALVTVLCMAAGAFLAWARGEYQYQRMGPPVGSGNRDEQ